MANLQISQLKFLDRGPYDFSVSDSNILAISGDSGAGKSLLLRAIADLDPHEGEMLLNGVSYLDFQPHDWRKNVSYLAAESFWWHETIAEHFINRPQLETLEKVNLKEEHLDVDIARLSTGERQRFAILRCLENKPGVILLDEPTASLDQASVKLVEELLLTYIKDNSASALWVSHDSAQATRVGDFTMHIKNGGDYILE